MSGETERARKARRSRNHATISEVQGDEPAGGSTPGSRHHLGGTLLAHASSSSNATTDTSTVATQQAADATSPADDFVTKLAANLGVNEQTLRDALKTTNLQAIDQALADRRITQQQADDARAAVNSGQAPLFGMPGHGPRGGPDGGHEGGPGMGDPAALATFLGVDAQTLQSDLQSGTTLAQEAEAHGKTRDELEAFLTSEFDSHVDADVAAGRMTAQQAADAKQHFASELDSRVDGQHGPEGPHHGRPGPGAAPAQGSGTTTSGA